MSLSAVYTIIFAVSSADRGVLLLIVLFSPLQKESINIVANLRATNEPLFTVTEVSGDPAVVTAEEGQSPAAGGSGPRIRKISGTLPPGKKFLTPSLSASDTSPRPDLKDRPMGFKRKRSLKVSRLLVSRSSWTIS